MMRATFLTHFILLDLVNLMARSANYDVPLLLFPGPNALPVVQSQEKNKTNIGTAGCSSESLELAPTEPRRSVSAVPK